MEKIKFRNHYSVVLEKMSGFVVVIILLLFQNIDNVLEMIKDFQNWKEVGMEQSLAAILASVGLLLLVGLIMGISTLVWSKTWITITDSTIIMERNTINKLCNTIGMKNVSNVNIEQSFMEKIIGTCKVKLDTNSLSTANQTDVKIVLKKARANEIQKIILERVNVVQGRETEPDRASKKEEKTFQYSVNATYKDVLLHGICSINVSTILILFGCISGTITAFTAFGDKMTGNLVSILADLVFLLFIVISCLKSLLGGFITYYDFKAGRNEDRLYIHYGLLRTIDYTIPVSKINAVIIHQTMIGRILKKYMVELVNVGMGDDKEEAGSYIILACNQQELQEQLQHLLPEFSSASIDRIERQPKTILWGKGIKTLIYSTVLIGTGTICTIAIPQIKVWMTVLACSLLIGYGICLGILEYRTAGLYIDENEILVANGCFRRDITIMPYKNIQYLRLNTNAVIKHWGLTRGSAFLLAALKNQVQSIPACEISKLETFIEENYIRNY